MITDWNDYVTKIQATRDETAITEPSVGHAFFAIGVVFLTAVAVIGALVGIGVVALVSAIF